MYLVKIFDPEYGMIEDVMPAADLCDAVGAAHERVGRSKDHRVVVGTLNGDVQVKVLRGDIVVASVESAPMATLADEEVREAADMLCDLGDATAITRLFAQEEVPA